MLFLLFSMLSRSTSKKAIFLRHCLMNNCSGLAWKWHPLKAKVSFPCLCQRTTDTKWLHPSFFATQIQIPIPNKYLWSGYKGLVFVEIMVDYLMENMDKGLKAPKWVLIFSSAENTYPKCPEFNCPICLPKPKRLGFWWKNASLGVRSPCLLLYNNMPHCTVQKANQKLQTGLQKL